MYWSAFIGSFLNILVIFEAVTSKQASKYLLLANCKFRDSIHVYLIIPI